MKNVIVPILGAVSIVSTGALAWLLATPASVDPRTVKLESELKEARQTIANLKSELARKSSAPVPVAVASSPAVSLPAAGLNAAAPGATGKNNLREMLNTPAMKAMIEQQQVAQIEVGYAQLFEQLRLTPEERENFKNILAARQKAQTDFGLQLMDPNLTPEQRQQLIDQTKRQMSVYEASIKDFLNNDNDWKSFKQWEDVQPERLQFDTMGRGLFTAAGEPLSQTQEQQLLNLMSEVRRSPSSVGALTDQTGTDPTRLTDDVISRQMEQLESNGRIVSERAAAFLSPGQQQTLKTYLNQMQTMSKSSIEMTKMIIRGGGK